ncbi:MAG TPA: FxLYD domain-containing protein [Pyrinomonadaceae bacterium]|nr:FxLYD domain-containing protein [Pyrinomonadaceae bacterium]
MRFSLVALLILAFAAVAYAQNPAIPREANPNLQIVDAQWVARGGTVSIGERWKGEVEVPHPQKSRNQVVSRATVLVKNTSNKPIKNFDLEYVFQDAGNTEFLRYQFHVKTNLKPGHTSKFVQDIYEKAGRYRYRYTPVKSRFDTLLKTNEAATKIIVRRIEYADGSVWERP